jgi:hypothetical protein
MPRSCSSGKHRLGTPGLMHCALNHKVAETLAGRRRKRLPAALMPARHSAAAVRRRVARAAGVHCVVHAL